MGRDGHSITSLGGALIACPGSRVTQEDDPETNECHLLE